MKTAPSPLVGLINGSSTFNICDLYDVFLSNGDNLRLSGTDRPVVYPATGTVLPPGTFVPAVGFKRGSVQWSAQPAVQALDVTLMVNEGVTYDTLVPGSVNTRPLAQLAREGIFDSARVKLYRAFFDSNSVLVDALLHFVGTIADVKPTSSTIALTVKSELDKLNRNLPRNIYQAGCNHAFLDEGCDPSTPGTLRAAHTTTGAIVGTPAPTKYVVAISGNFTANTWQLGAIKMTSGVLDGQVRGVRSDTNSGANHALTLSVPFSEAPLVGATYSLITGCDKKFTTCTSRYANQSRYRGFQFVPQPEDAVTR